MSVIENGLPDDYLIDVTPTGYEVWYKKEFLSGVGTRQSSYCEQRVHWKIKQKDIKEYRIQALRCIEKDYKLRFNKEIRLVK
jgi:hypothetical protein